MATELTALVLGCGRRTEDYGLTAHAADGTPIEATWRVIRLDANPDVRPDLLCELGYDDIPLEDDSVDLAIAMHVLEHIGTQGETRAWFQFWEELYRVLKPGGRLQFEVPLASSVWAWADPTHVRALNEYSFLYVNQDAYRCGGAIPDYRVRCDFAPIRWERVPDRQNSDVQAREAESFLRGTLIARKPLRAWWADETPTEGAA